MPQNHIVYIGLGSNLGRKRENIGSALEAIGVNERIEVCRVSGIIETKPLAKKKAPDYLNCVAEIKTSLSPLRLLDFLQSAETLLGRRRSEEKWQSRIIDIDILLFGNEIIETERLVVPHSQMHLRTFVLAGLCELCPDFVHPVLGGKLSVLRDRLGGNNFYTDGCADKLISIAGCIGAGKSTLAVGLSEKYGFKLIKEAYDDNPFLPAVYSGKKELALDSQLYFLLSRTEQLKMHRRASGSKQNQTAVSDYIMDKELIYARLWLDAVQFDMYEKINSAVCKTIVAPTVVVYLRLEPKKCLERIKVRHRPYEQEIEMGFLEKLCGWYDKLFEKFNRCPVVTVDAEKFDFRDTEQVSEFGREINYYLGG